MRRAAATITTPMIAHSQSEMDEEEAPEPFPDDAVTLRLAEPWAVFPWLSVTVTVIEKLPVAVGVHDQEVAFSVTQPLGSPVYA
jgi:hypothetical protein